MANQRQKRLRKIMVAATISGTAGRDYLSGVFKFVGKGREWNLEVLDDPATLDKRIRQSEEPDGVIIMLPHENPTLVSLQRRNIPTVVVDFPPKGFAAMRGSLSFVRLNDAEIGAAAAQHLLDRGNFNSFLCVIDQPQFAYSRVRESAFRERLKATGRFVKTVLISDIRATERDQHALLLTLKRLPRPVGVFVTRDRAASRVYDACRDLGFSIPDEVAVIGVDNDELFCNTAAVPLSSILPDHAQVGYLAAKELNRLLHGGTGKETVFRKSVREVVLRASTRIIPPTARIVTEALAFIEDNASGSLSVADVVEHIGISRRLADLRFRQIRNETILDAIVRARIGRIKKRLLTSNDPLSRIAADCGFSSAAVFSRFFRTHVGETPQDWRLKRH